MRADKKHRLQSWSFVVAQFLLIILLIIVRPSVGPSVTTFPRLGLFVEWVGWLAIIFSAYNIRNVLTAQPLPKKGGKLVTEGLYKHARHPMYTGVMLIVLGIALLSGSAIKYLLVIALAVLFHYKVRYEEKYLLKEYPEYKEYAKRTPKFIPYLFKRK